MAPRLNPMACTGSSGSWSRAKATRSGSAGGRGERVGAVSGQVGGDHGAAGVGEQVEPAGLAPGRGGGGGEAVEEEHRRSGHDGETLGGWRSPTALPSWRSRARCGSPSPRSTCAPVHPVGPAASTPTAPTPGSSSPSTSPRRRRSARPSAAASASKLGPVVRLTVDEHRSQARNRALAYERLAERLAAALKVDRPRKRTKPSKAAAARRLDAKRRQSDRKRDRTWKHDD